MLRAKRNFSICKYEHNVVVNRVKQSCIINFLMLWVPWWKCESKSLVEYIWYIFCLENIIPGINLDSDVKAWPLEEGQLETCSASLTFTQAKQFALIESVRNGVPEKPAIGFNLEDAGMTGKIK